MSCAQVAIMHTGFDLNFLQLTTSLPDLNMSYPNPHSNSNSRSYSTHSSYQSYGQSSSSSSSNQPRMNMPHASSSSSSASRARLTPLSTPSSASTSSYSPSISASSSYSSYPSPSLSQSSQSSSYPSPLSASSTSSYYSAQTSMSPYPNSPVAYTRKPSRAPSLSSPLSYSPSPFSPSPFSSMSGPSSSSSSNLSPSPWAAYRGIASEILPNLYISDMSFAESSSCLTSMGITHIVSVVQDVLPPLPQGLRWIERMQIAVEDMPFAELVGHLPSATRWIDEALSTGSNGRGNGRPAKVLVHCHEGVSRSVSVVIAYLMMKYRWHPDQALEYIRSKREIANPNFGFKRQLAEYAMTHLGMKNVKMPTC